MFRFWIYALNSFLVPCFSWGQSSLETDSMLFQAKTIAKTYAPLVAKASPPNPAPQTDALLTYASNWFSIDLATVETKGKSVLETLANPLLWDCLAQIGIEGVELKGLKSQGPQSHFQIDPQWGTEANYRTLANEASKKGICLIGKIIGNATGKGADFALALKNVGAYPELYAMVEIAPQDWDLLPDVNHHTFAANIPWLTVQKLHNKGYIPSHFEPYVKESSWNATEPISGEGKMRRWIYLRNEMGFPYLDWLNPSFGALRLAAADCLYTLFALGQPILQFDPLPQNAEQTLALTARKLGAFSAAVVTGGVEALDRCTDATYNHLLPMATLHAIVTEDVEILRLIYQLLLEKNVQPKRLVHALEPFGRNPNDWAEFLHSPQKKHVYHQEEMTAFELRNRLFKEETLRLKGEMEKPLSWETSSDQPITICDLEKKRTVLVPMHLTLAKFFAWQPGIFSISPEDLLGAAPHQKTVDLLSPNPECLYSCVPTQLQNPRSFASALKQILRVRKDSSIAGGTLREVVPSDDKGTLILKLQLRQNLTNDPVTALLAVNLSSKQSVSTLESPEYAQTSAIDLSTQQTENKSFESSFFDVKLEARSAKLILFQPRRLPKK